MTLHLRLLQRDPSPCIWDRIPKADLWVRHSLGPLSLKGGVGWRPCGHIPLKAVFSPPVVFPEPSCSKLWIYVRII